VLFSDEVLVEERGYRVIDPVESCLLCERTSCAIGFSYNTEFKKKPLVFAVSDERPAELVKTH